MRSPGPDRERRDAAAPILAIVDPDEHREPALFLLRQMFDLTAAEARVALCLTRGLETREIAAAHKVAEGTIRTQLKSLFTKTGTNRRAQLVAFLGRVARVPYGVCRPNGGEHGGLARSRSPDQPGG